MSNDLGFSYQARNNECLIYRNGKKVTVLRGEKAQELLAELDAGGHGEQQQLMARITGNYKRGNERLAKNHARNR